MTNRSIALYLLIIALLLVGAIGWYAYSFLSQPAPESPVSYAQRADEDVRARVTFGSQAPGTERHTQDSNKADNPDKI